MTAAEIEITTGHGSKVYISDGGAADGVKASRSHGASDGQLVINWGKHGTIGNSKHTEIIENGNNTPLSVVVTESKVTVYLATDGSGEGISTPNDVIAELYKDATFLKFWGATNGAGDGTDALVADYADAALTGGTNGTEVFTEIPGVFDGPEGPGVAQQTLEARSHSWNGAKRKVTDRTWSPCTFKVYKDTSNEHIAQLLAAARESIETKFRVQSTETGGEMLEFIGYVDAAPSAPVDGWNVESISISVDGEPTVV